MYVLLFLNDTATTEIYTYWHTLPLHDALPILPQAELLDHAAAGSWTIKPSGPARQRNDRFSLFRKVGAIHDNHRYAVVIRNLSTTGALIEGIDRKSTRLNSSH